MQFLDPLEFGRTFQLVKRIRKIITHSLNVNQDMSLGQHWRLILPGQAELNVWSRPGSVTWSYELYCATKYFTNKYRTGLAHRVLLTHSIDESPMLGVTLSKRLRQIYLRKLKHYCKYKTKTMDGLAFPFSLYLDDPKA